MTRIDGRLIVAFTVLFVLLSSHLAHGQQSGYSIAPNGQVTQWDAQGGSSYGPAGTSSWDRSGGYVVNPGGGYSTWTGPVQPVVPSDSPQFVLPNPDPDPLPPLP